MKEDSFFDLGPEQLNRLLLIGTEEGPASGEAEAGVPRSENVPGSIHDCAPLASIVEQPGGWIGRYRLLQVLGKGGMGVVYLAEQQEPMRRSVALKIIKLGMDTRQVIARFEAERQALALMNHPNIAKVLDAGATETGRPYFVMELVAGIPITEYCDKSSLSTDDRLALFLQVCNAVQHAHTKGIIHRDIKPSNVLVTLLDGTPVPKVIDFGIAKAMDQRLTEETLLTRHGHIIGTPVYMSPEQAELSEPDIDTRSDIYSLGVLLYELLTGTTPFSQEELRKAGYVEMQRVIREQVPMKPSTRLSTLGDTLNDVAKRRNSTPGLLRHAVRGDLDWIAMKALEKDRVRRYETASGLTEDIRRHLEHKPVLARRPTPTYRLRKFFRRHRSQVLATLLPAVAVVAAIVFMSLWNRDRGQLAEAQGLRHRAILLQGREQYARGERETALATIEPILRSQNAGAEAQLLQARILVDDGQFEEATAMLRGLLTERPEVAGVAHSLLACILWGSESLNVEKLKEIERHRRQAEVLLPETADAYFLRAMTSVTVKEQLVALDRALQLDPRHYESRRLRAFIYCASRKYEKMKDDALGMTILRPWDPLGYSLRAIARHQLGSLSEAVTDYGLALERTSTTDPQYVELTGRRCEALMRMGRYERVLVEARECLKNAPNATALQAQVFCALTALGRYEEATALMQSIAESHDDADDQIWQRSVKHVVDTLAAGGVWHPPSNKPEGPAFFYMLEAEQMYRSLSAKARRLITDCFSPCWSPDGTQVAFALGLPGYSGVAVYDLESRETNLLIVPGKAPKWSPDGRHIAFVRNAQALRPSELTRGRKRSRTAAYYMGEEVWLMKADGSEPRRLARRANSPSWSPDARRVYYHSYVDRMLYSLSIEDAEAQPVPVCACSSTYPTVSPQGGYVANVNGGADRGAVLRIVDPATQSCIAEWPTPLESVTSVWSPDGRELTLGGLNGIRTRTGLWIYDLAKGEAVKVLSGHIRGASWSLDRTHLLIHLSDPYWETWVADLDPSLPTAESLRPVQTLEEHCLEAIATCTRELEVDPDSFVSRWTRAASALWIGHPQAPVYLQELDLRLGRPPFFRPSWRNALAAQNILAHPALCERLEPLALILARRAVEQQPSHAEELAPTLERAGRHEQAARLLQIAQADTLKGSLRYDGESATYTAVGCGADIWGVTDEFHFAYKKLQGNGSITARIESIENIHPWTKAGVMIRENLDPGAEFAAVFATPGGGVSFHTRPVADRNVTADEHLATPKQAALRVPVWVRVERKGNQFSAFYSSDGTAWTQMVWSPQTVSMSNHAYIGLAVTSHDNKKTAEARISHVTTSGDIDYSAPFDVSQDIRPQLLVLPDVATGKDPNDT